MRLHPSRWAALLCVVGATGCLSAPDAPDYRYLAPLAVERGASERAQASQRILVRDVAADEGARDVLAWRLSPTRVELRPLDRWAVRPVDFVRRAARARFDGATASETVQLELELVHFGGAGPVDAPRAELELFATAILPSGETRSRTVRTERALDPTAWRDDLCRALGELTDEAFNAIVADLAR